MIRRIASKDTFLLQEVRSGSVLGKFFGRGQQDTTLLTVQGVLNLIKKLPGANASEKRDKFAAAVLQNFPEISVAVVPTNVAQTLTTSIAVKEDEKDIHGNKIMNLASIGLNATVRFVRFEDCVLFSQLDVVKAVCSKDNNRAGFLKLL